MSLEKPKMLTIAAEIYQSLAEDIAKGRLAPGHKLEEKTIAERFGASRTPVREALRELGARGLVVMTPHRGGMVAEIDADQITDMLEAECEIEANCARLAAQRMTPVEREQLYSLHEEFSRCVERNDFEAARTTNRQFHDQICRGGHNRTLAALAVDLRLRLAPFRQNQYGSETDRMHLSLGEHEAIVDAIRKQDPAAAYQATTQHNTRLSTGVLRLLTKVGSQTA
jgi:DNA-binding GntR family transcriptional regulator